MSEKTAISNKRRMKKLGEIIKPIIRHGYSRVVKTLTYPNLKVQRSS